MRIAILDDYQDVALQMADWDRLSGEVTRFGDTVSGAALVERLRPFEVVCLMRERTPLPAELIEALPNLQLLVTTGRHNASIDIAAARRAGVTVCGTQSRSAATVHHVMTLILMGTRRLFPEIASMRDGGWQVGIGRDLDGLVLGTIGAGRLGAEIARLGQAFGMEVVAWSANLTDARAAEIGARRAPSLAALLGEADVASIHLTLSERTRGLVGAAELAHMKPDALLVNTSRGPILGWQPLLEALRAGRPGAAALDVYDDEPLPADHPLRDRTLIDSGRLLLTPHVGYVARQTYETMYGQVVENIAAWTAGEPIRTLEA